MPTTRERYYVSALRGYLSPNTTGAHQGTSFTIHDRAYNCRAVPIYRTEDSRPSGGVTATAHAERRAEARCPMLNLWHEVSR